MIQQTIGSLDQISSSCYNKSGGLALKSIKVRHASLVIEVAKRKDTIYKAISDVAHAQTRIYLFENFLRELENKLQTHLETREIEVSDISRVGL